MVGQSGCLHNDFTALLIRWKDRRSMLCRGVGFFNWDVRYWFGHKKALADVLLPPSAKYFCAVAKKFHLLPFASHRTFRFIFGGTLSFVWSALVRFSRAHCNGQVGTAPTKIFLRVRLLQILWPHQYPMFRSANYFSMVKLSTPNQV